MQSGDYRGSDGAFKIITTQQLEEYKYKAMRKRQGHGDVGFACLTVSEDTNLIEEIILL